MQLQLCTITVPPWPHAQRRVCILACIHVIWEMFRSYTRPHFLSHKMFTLRTHRASVCLDAVLEHAFRMASGCSMSVIIHMTSCQESKFIGSKHMPHNMANATLPSCCMHGLRNSARPLIMCACNDTSTVMVYTDFVSEQQCHINIDTPILSPSLFRVASIAMSTPKPHSEHPCSAQWSWWPRIWDQKARPENEPTQRPRTVRGCCVGAVSRPPFWSHILAQCLWPHHDLILQSQKRPH